VLYTKLGQHTVNAVRFAEVLQVFARHGFADLLRRAGFYDGLPARVLRRMNLMNAAEGEPATFGQRLRSALVELGPTFVKFGQILSTRPDVIGTDTAKALSSLQDQVDPIEFGAVRPQIERSLGGTVEELFREFDTKPVASASLSQVYKAVLPDGTPVAVKVQRPKVTTQIETDLSLMAQIADWLADHVEDVRWLDPAGIVDEFSRSIKRELDFTIEARVIDQFRRNFEDEPAIFVPCVFHDRTSSIVLTMDWVDGVRVDELDAYAERASDPSEVAREGCRILCQMVFEHRLFHADPHPGNVMLLRDNQLAFLDLGMAGHIERADVAAIADLFLAIFHGDSQECVKAILNLTAQGQLENLTGLEHEIAEFIAFEAQVIIGGGQVARGIDRAMQILHRHHLELASRFSLLLKALATIEIVGRSLDPKLDFLPIIQPYVETLILERFHPSHVLREAQRSGVALLSLGRQLPGDVTYLIQRLRAGKIRFQVQHENLNPLANAIEKAGSRVAFGFIIAALIVGSSMLVASGAQLQEWGLGGYIFAAILGFGLVFSIWWSRKV